MSPPTPRTSRTARRSAPVRARTTTSPSDLPSKRRSRHGRRLTEAERAGIVAAYEAGDTYAEIQRRFGIAKNTVGAVLHGNGVTRRKGPSQRSERLGSRVAQEYAEGASQSDLSRRFGFSLGTIARILDREGVARRSLSECHLRHYPVKHDAFKGLTAESAYWTGFVMADGCISGKSSVELTSHVRDKEHLERFLKFVGSGDRPVLIRGTLAISLVNSRQVVSDLARHGVVPRKSYGARASHEVAQVPSFWLGVIDGDGTIGVSRAPYIALCGSEPLMEQYSDFLADAVLDGQRQRIFGREPDGLCFVRLEGESARRLAGLLYSNSPLCLPRSRRLDRGIGCSGLVNGEAGMVWATARWKAAVPRSVREFANGRAVFVLHLSPAHPDYSVLNRVEGVEASTVPLTYLREMSSQLAA